MLAGRRLWRRLHAVARGGVGAVGLPAAAARPVEAAARKAVRQVLLVYPAGRIAVRIAVVAVVFRSRAVPVAQMVGHGARGPVAHLGQRGVDACLGGVALGRERQVDGRLRQVDAAFGIADDLGRLEGGRSHQKRVGIGVADILRCGDEHAPRDELGVLSPVDHAGEPIERRIRIAAAHGLDERGDDVVVHVLVLVVRQAAMRRGGAHLVLGQQGGRVRRTGLHHAGSQLQRGERAASVASRHEDDRVARLVVERVTAPQAPLVGERTVDECGQVLVGQSMELDHARARYERRVHFEERVFRGGAHQHQDAVFHGMKERVLLAAVEPVDLVHEQDGAQAAHGQALLGCVDFTPQVGHRAAHG